MGWKRRSRYLVIVTAVSSLLGAGCRAPADGDRTAGTRAQQPPASAHGRPATTLPLTTLPVTTFTTPVLPPPGAAGARAVVTPTGVIVPILATAPKGWLVRTPCHATTTLTRGTPVGHATVVLDPGHGGAERGAIAPSGLAEADVNLQVARRAQEALRAVGVTVLLTRTGDYDVDLATRAELVTSVAPLAFVSVHHNAEPDRARPGPGSETYYQHDSADSKRLAGLVYEEVTRALSRYRVAWAAYRDAGAQNRPGSHGDYYAILRWTRPVVGVLAELAFISNPPEAELLGGPDVQHVEGEAVARGIVRYLSTHDPGSGFTEPAPRPEPPPAPGTAQPCRDAPL